MAIGVSILLIALGAVLFWGIDHEIAGVDLDVIGVIAMAAGVVAAFLALTTSARGDRQRSVVRRNYKVER
jgi:hypothetical protein